MSILPFFLLLAGVLVSVNEASSIGSKIVGGEATSISDFPYQVSLRKYLGRHSCGGSLISRTKVLTAAHCVVSNTADELHIVTGSTSLVSGGEYHAVSHVVYHEDYVGRDTSWLNDIAILTLATPAEASENQSTIPFGISTIPGGVEGIASGWGRSVYPGVTVPTELQKLNVTTLSKEDCQVNHTLTIYDEHICSLATLGQGICSGDSGGPLVADGVLIGIASWANLCANNIPDVWVRVSSYFGWILEHLSDA